MMEAQQFSDIQVRSQDGIAEVNGAVGLAVGLAAETGVVAASLTVVFVAGAVPGVAYYGWQYYNSSSLCGVAGTGLTHCRALPERPLTRALRSRPILIIFLQVNHVLAKFLEYPINIFLAFPCSYFSVSDSVPAISPRWIILRVECIHDRI